MEKLDPDLLAKLLAMAQGETGQWYDPTGAMPGWTVDRRRDVIGNTGGDAGTEIYGDPITRLYNNTGHETWGQDTANVFDAQGNYIGPSSGDSEALSLAKFIASAVGGYYGTEALNGAYGAATTGAGAGAEGAVNGAFLGEGAASGIPAWDAALSGTAAGTAGGTAATTAATQAAQQAGTKTATDKLLDTLTNGKVLAGVAGAVAGAADGGDKQETSSRDPWAPAQDFLKQQLAQGQQLSQQYQAQPFSQAQQTAYGNMGSLLDLVNRNAGGLLSGFQANASGANQFQRGQPRGLIGSNFNPTAQEWQPGLLGNFGTRKG